METLKQKVLKKFCANHNFTTDDMVDMVLDHLLNSLPGERNGLNEEWCLGYNNMREEIITLITNAKK